MVFTMSHDWKYSVAFPHGAVCLPAVCECLRDDDTLHMEVRLLERVELLALLCVVFMSLSHMCLDLQ